MRTPVAGQLHLTPLHATLQMRPELVYIDDGETARKKAEIELANVGKDVEPKQSKIVSVHIRKAETERQAELKRSSYSYLTAMHEAEAWVDLQVVPREVCTRCPGVCWLVVVLRLWLL